MIPLTLFGMIVAIAYQQEIALLLSAAMTLIAIVAPRRTVLAAEVNQLQMPPRPLVARKQLLEIALGLLHVLCSR